MAYNPSKLKKLFGRTGEFKIWTYDSTADIADVNTAGHISDGQARGMEVGDWVIVRDTDASPPASWICNVVGFTNGAANLSNGLAVTATDSD